MSKRSHLASIVRAAIIILLVVLLAQTAWFQAVDSRSNTALASDLPVPDISGDAAVVLDGNNGDILYEKSPHVHYAPASITKIVTAIVALDEKGDKLNVQIPIDFDSYQMVLDADASVMGLKPGDDPSLRDLLYGLMLPSGADAAVAIARYVGGGGPNAEQRFVDMMNEKMRQLGLTDSHFVNPHGLDAKGHYTSAYDMAAVSFYGMKNATFRQLASATKYQVIGQRTYEIWNLNRLLYNYDGADGIKIGYTENALETIVASATRGPFTLIVSVMHSNDRYSDARALMDYFFDALSKGTVTRIPAPTQVPTPTLVPTSTPIPPNPTPALAPASTAASPTPAADQSIWSDVGNLLGSILRAVGLGR